MVYYTMNGAVIRKILQLVLFSFCFIKIRIWLGFSGRQNGLGHRFCGQVYCCFYQTRIENIKSLNAVNAMPHVYRLMFCQLIQSYHLFI